MVMENNTYRDILINTLTEISQCQADDLRGFVTGQMEMIRLNKMNEHISLLFTSRVFGVVKTSSVNWNNVSSSYTIDCEKLCYALMRLIEGERMGELLGREEIKPTTSREYSYLDYSENMTFDLELDGERLYLFTVKVFPSIDPMRELDDAMTTARTRTRRMSRRRSRIRSGTTTTTTTVTTTTTTTITSANDMDVKESGKSPCGLKRKRGGYGLEGMKSHSIKKNDSKSKKNKIKRKSICCLLIFFS